jgi:hypothetical protein
VAGVLLNPAPARNTFATRRLGPKTAPSCTTVRCVQRPRLSPSFVIAPLALVGLGGLACGGSTPAARSGPTMTCPAPIGTVPKEDCADVADDFGALNVQDALARVGAGKFSEPRVEAIRAVGALAQSIKEQRVKLCQAYVKCKVPLVERDAQDQLLTGAMRSLIDLWNKRRFTGLDEVVRFRAAVRAIDQRVNGAEGGEQAARPPRTFKADEVLARLEDPGVAFRVEPGSVTVTATAEGKRDALLSKPEVLALPSGHRYRVKLSGSYRPASPPLVQPGDELTARLKYHAEGAADLQLALRSLEDPDAAEAADRWHAGAGERGTREAKLTADPQQTGFYLGVTVKGAAVDLDDVELLRAGKVLIAAKAGDPGVKIDCAAAGGAKPAAGARSFHCLPGDGDRVTLGQPEGYLVIGLRDATGLRASTRALSLEGGRSVDALVGEEAQLVITLVGAGSARLETVEITDVSP